MKIAVVIWALMGGGAERTAANLANAWAERGHDVSVVTHRARSTDQYDLDERVTRAEAPVRFARLFRPPVPGVKAARVIALRRALRRVRPDVVVGILPPTTIALIEAARPLGIPTIVREGVHPPFSPLGKMWERARREQYPEAGAVVVQSELSAVWARAFVPAQRVHVVPNFVRAPVSVLERDPDGRTILAVGRIHPLKGFDLLLDAFERTEARRRGWRVRIVGADRRGYRPGLEEHADRLGLSDAVTFVGRVADVWSEYARAEMFVLSSRGEGFPNVLLEAMSSGSPVIAFDCPTGPSDIVTDGVDGLLVPDQDVGALARAIDRLAADRELRRELGDRARDVPARFSEERILRLWDDVIGSCG